MTDEPNNNLNAISVVYYGIDADVLEKASGLEDFISLWMRVKEAEQYAQFLKGDIADKVAVKHGEQSLEKFAQAVGEKFDTVVAYRRTARAFPLEKRGLNLTWTHYLLASHTDEFDKSEGKFNSDNRFDWIEKAHDEGWSSYRLAQEIKEGGAVKDEPSAFERHLKYLERFRNIVLHITDNLSQLEKIKLLDEIEVISIGLQKHLKTRYTHSGVSYKQRKAMLGIIEFMHKHKDKLAGSPPLGNGVRPAEPKVSLSWSEEQALWSLKIPSEDWGKVDLISFASMLENCFIIENQTAV